MVNSTQGIKWVPNLFAYVGRTIFSQYAKNSANLKVLQKINQVQQQSLTLWSVKCNFNMHHEEQEVVL